MKDKTLCPAHDRVEQQLQQLAQSVRELTPMVKETLDSVRVLLLEHNLAPGSDSSYETEEVDAQPTSASQDQIRAFEELRAVREKRKNAGQPG